MVDSLAIPVLAGLLCGGAVNLVADSLPQTRRLGMPVCAQCGNPYAWRLYLTGGACPKCGHRRGYRPWVVMAVMVAMAVYTWIQPHRMGFALGILLLTYFAVVIVVDVEHRLILHPTSIVGGVLGAGVGFWLQGIYPTLLGGIAGIGIMSVCYGLGVGFSRLRARRLSATGRQPDGEDVLGAGDVILGGILGLILGWPMIWFALLLGIILGGLLGVILIVAAMVRGRYGQQALMIFMPYGPSFVVSAFLILFLPKLIAGLVPK